VRLTRRHKNYPSADPGLAAHQPNILEMLVVEGVFSEPVAADFPVMWRGEEKALRIIRLDVS
jgi:hypothetical protein